MSELAENYPGIVSLLYVVIGSFVYAFFVKIDRPREKTREQRIQQVLEEQEDRKKKFERINEANHRTFTAVQECPHCLFVGFHPFEIKTVRFGMTKKQFLELSCLKCKKKWNNYV